MPISSASRGCLTMPAGKDSRAFGRNGEEAMQITVFGATGVLGRHVVPRLCERGHLVRAVVRRQEQAAKLQRLGVKATLGDILDAASLADTVTGSEAVLHLATAIP